MQKGVLFIMDAGFFEYSRAFERALVGLDIKIIKIPFFPPEELTIERLRTIRKILKEYSSGRFSIFLPGTAEYYLDNVDQIFAFSAYRNWYSTKPIRVIPHVWTNVNTPEDNRSLRWTDKPPLRIGFMGSSYLNSRVANFVSGLPRAIKIWLLTGAYTKRIDLLALLYQSGISLRNITCFARMETVKSLNYKKRDYGDVELDIIEAPGFSGSEQEKNQFARHLEKMTYIICPRGIENFSIRVYEALKFGRIPVIIDTNMVLPEEVDWNRISIRVPYDSLDKIYDIILHDYNSRSGSEFMERQQAAFSTMTDLETMRWLTKLLRKTFSLPQVV